MTLPYEQLLLQAMTQGAVPPMGGASTYTNPAYSTPGLMRRPPVQPVIPMQGQYGQLAQRMAGPMPVTSAPSAPPPATGMPQTPSPPGGGMHIPQPVMGGGQGMSPSGMQLPPGLSSPMQLMQLMQLLRGGGHGE